MARERHVRIAFGTVFGNARKIAETIAEEAPSHGWRMTVSDLEEYETVHELL
jgi:menaquinone-dependent protoporphyrinogen IX oxidase